MFMFWTVAVIAAVLGVIAWWFAPKTWPGGVRVVFGLGTVALTLSVVSAYVSW